MQKAREELREATRYERNDRAIEVLAGPLTDEQRERLALLLQPHAEGGDGHVAT